MVAKNGDRERISTLEVEVSSLQREIANIGKANYPLYIAAVGMTITLVGAILFPFIQNIRKLEEADRVLGDRSAKLESQEAVNTERLWWVVKLADERKENRDENKP